MEKPLQVFCCYAREDQQYLLLLKKHLRPLERRGSIIVQADIDVSPGEEWEKKISHSLNTAHMILLLVSPSFMDSDYCYSKEMKRAMERHEQGEVCVIPVILRPTLWNEAPFGKLQVLPKDGKSVTNPRWRNRDEAFFNVIEGIQRTIEALCTSSSPLVSTHSISKSPVPPEPYIAHRYVLMETRTFIGRQAELKMLTDWAATPEIIIPSARILSIVSIGGVGKSALTWKWFHDIAPFEINPLKGRIWWSFYENNATFENFIIYALTCMKQLTTEEIQRASRSEREAKLLECLDKEPYLIVFDGLERILSAYADIDAVYQDVNMKII